MRPCHNFVSTCGWYTKATLAISVNLMTGPEWTHTIEPNNLSSELCNLQRQLTSSVHPQDGNNLHISFIVCRIAAGNNPKLTVELAQLCRKEIDMHRRVHQLCCPKRLCSVLQAPRLIEESWGRARRSALSGRPERSSREWRATMTEIAAQV